MKRNIKMIILAVVISLSLVGFTMAESKIVDSMDFTGDAISLTLDEAIEIMLEGNPTVEQAQLDKEEAEVEYSKNKSTLGKSKSAYKNKSEDSMSYLQNVKLLELTTNYGINSAERNYEATIEKLKANMEESYFNLLQAQDSEEINKTNMEIAKDLHEKTKKKFELGLIAKQEVLNSELNLIEAENEYKIAVDNIKLAKMSFNQNLDYDIMTNIELQGKLEYKEFELGSIADAISKALTNRNEVKAAEFNAESQEINLAIIGKKYTENTYSYREQKIVAEKAKRSLEDTKKGIEIEVRSNYLDVIQKQEAIKSGEKSVELAVEALRLSQLSYEVGMSVLTDVQQAQTTLLQAKLGLSNAILDYNLAVMEFEDSIGVGRTSL